MFGMVDLFFSFIFIFWFALLVSELNQTKRNETKTEIPNAL